MTDYIPREAVIDCIDKAYDPGYDLGYCVDNDMFKNMIKEIPAEDVQPVVRGKWIETEQPMVWGNVVSCATCSACGHGLILGEWATDDVRREMHYCMHCGARMDLEAETDV